MSAPESQTSADQALSSLMGVVGDNPEASRLESAPVATPRDWNAVQAAIDDYLEGYELRLDEGCYRPQEFERFLLVDAIAGLMDDDDFIDALYSAVTAARAAPAAGDAQDAKRYRWLCDRFGVTKLPCAIERIIEGKYVADGKASIDAAIDAAIAAQQQGEA